MRVGEGFSDKAQRGCPAGRRIGSGQPPAQHKSIAGGCLFPCARRHSAGPEPESRDAGVSRFSGNGSHLAESDAAEGHAGQVDGPGSSRNAGTGSHLAREGAAEGLAGDDPPGANENGQVRRWDVGKGKARRRTFRQKIPPTIHGNMSGKNGISTDKTVHPEPFSRRNAPLPGQKPDAQTRQCSSTAARTRALFDKARCSLCRRGHKPNTCGKRLRSARPVPRASSQPPWHKRSTLQYLPGGVLGVHFLDNALKNAVLVEDECTPERPQCGLTVHFLLTPRAEGLEHLRGGVRK